ncbi:Uma2 family endonuclease [Jiella avicenniae]|uniref:Uma2 family endonuclease n=1 Tax=Jiella avicenniae TaxID=2907202 RepID=A0A9X1T5K1_9HYPH|nr:Uma2 family endonuclease [Jiella avicenniae]MCE7028270.1 Uma2 family endonuclease [Jiella avicenniae]
MSSLVDPHRRDDLPTNMTIDEFFDWLDTHEDHYELVDGTPIMMPFVKRAHARIVSNFDFCLQSRIDRLQYMVTQGDFAIRTGPRSIRFADVLVEPSNDDLAGRISERTVLIVEVLSESTARIDFNRKRLEYLGLADLDTYVIAAQDEPRLWVWQRTPAGWPEAAEVLTEGSVAVPSLGVSLPLAEIYRGVHTIEGKTGAT